MLAANETELHQLVPDSQNLRAKAKILLSHGLQNIIVTLGPNGCFYMNHQEGMNFGAAKISPVDVAGAGDGFISVLVAFL